jgi:hypothetical protein
VAFFCELVPVAVQPQICGKPSFQFSQRFQVNRNRSSRLFQKVDLAGLNPGKQAVHLPTRMRLGPPDSPMRRLFMGRRLSSKDSSSILALTMRSGDARRTLLSG